MRISRFSWSLVLLLASPAFGATEGSMSAPAPYGSSKQTTPAGNQIAATGLIGQMCAQWGNGCQNNCEAQVPTNRGATIGSTGGAGIGGVVDPRQRARQVAACWRSCMAQYPLCK